MSSASVGQKRRYWNAAPDHLAWCRDHGVEVIDGCWSLEDPISSLLLSAVLMPSSATTLLDVLCRSSWSQVEVTSAWWPSKYVDLIVHFVGDGEANMLVLENKHLTTPSNQPGWKALKKKGLEHKIVWQTESILREIDRLRADDADQILNGPFDPVAKIFPVFLDAAARTMEEAFPVYEWMGLPHRHDEWSAVSYAELAQGLRESYEREPDPLLKPLLGHLFAA